MNENQIWLGLALGLVPYRICRQWLPGGERTLELRALFWSLALHRGHRGRVNWTLRVPLIERLRDLAWAAVARLSDDDSSQP